MICISVAVFTKTMSMFCLSKTIPLPELSLTQGQCYVTEVVTFVPMMHWGNWTGVFRKLQKKHQETH